MFFSHMFICILALLYTYGGLTFTNIITASKCLKYVKLSDIPKCDVT